MDRSLYTQKKKQNRGGVALYVDKGFKYKEVESMTAAEMYVEKKGKYNCELHIQNNRVKHPNIQELDGSNVFLDFIDNDKSMNNMKIINYFPLGQNQQIK